MLFIPVITISFLIASCQVPEGSLTVDETKSACENKSGLGQDSICMPFFVGKTDYFKSDKTVADFAIKSFPEETDILAYYILTDYREFDPQNLTSYSAVWLVEEDDYFVYYTLKDYANRKISDKAFEDFVSNFEKGFRKKEWKQIMDLYEKNPNNKFFYSPAVFDEFQVNSDSKTFLSFMKTNVTQETEYFYLQSTSLMHVNGKLVVCNYYSQYDGKESLKKFRHSSKVAVQALFDANKGGFAK